MRTLVTFASRDFNTSEPKDYFVNPTCFGDDVAKWMAQELRSRGFQPVGQPGQEDFGWYLTFLVDQVKHVFVIGFRPGDERENGTWIGWLERGRGFIGSVILGRRGGVRLAASRAIHAILSASPHIHDVRWHEQADFDSGREESGSEAP